MRRIALLLALICRAGCGATVSRFTGGPSQEFPVYGAECERRPLRCDGG